MSPSAWLPARRYRGPGQPKGISISSTRRMDEYTFLVSDATPNPLERQGRRVVGGQESGYRTLMPRGAGSHRHGTSAGATRIAAGITSQVSGSGPLRLAPDAARWHECEPRA